MARLLHVLNMPHYAGTERVYVQHGLMLAAMGHQLLCLMPHGSIAAQHLNHPNITVMEDDAVHLNKGRFNPILWWRYRTLLTHEKIEAVLVSSGGLAKLFRPITRGICPLIAVNHNTSAKGSSRADAVITVNRPVYDAIQKQHALPAGHTLLLFNSIAAPDTMPKPHPTTPPTITYLGRMDENKSVETLLHACTRLQQHGIPFALKLGGDGPSRPKLEALARERCLPAEFVGWVQDQTAFFRGASLMVCCSLSEGFPLVILEAMRAGVPVVSSDFDGVSDLVQHEKTGLTFARQNDEDLAAQITRLLLNPAQAHIFAEQALARLKQEFSEAAAAEKLHIFINRLIERKA